jgi:hypothetical protein
VVDERPGTTNERPKRTNAGLKRCTMCVDCQHGHHEIVKVRKLKIKP